MGCAGSGTICVLPSERALARQAASAPERVSSCGDRESIGWMQLLDRSHLLFWLLRYFTLIKKSTQSLLLQSHGSSPGNLFNEVFETKG